MSRILPILFNADMVRAILDGRKTVTRRIVKQSVWEVFVCERGKVINYFDKKTDALESPTYKAPFQIGDILYVRETWAFMPCIECNRDYIRDIGPLNCYDYQAVEYDDGDSISDGCFLYRADCKRPERINWRPSIHMPKQAARIWLKATDVRVERLHDISPEDLRKEGMKLDVLPEECEIQYDKIGAIYFCQEAREDFSKLWDSTIKKQDLERYGWDVNPWVWVIEFEQCEKQEACIINGIEPASENRPCVGYQKSKEDDEPCEMCKGCKGCDGEETEVQDA